MTFPERIQVLELFSGIGGMRYAFNKALRDKGISPEVLYEPLEINPSAVDVYSHNFEPTKTKNVHRLSKMNLSDFDVLLMSPPCQPFTRQGNQKGLCDNRSQPFLEVMDIIPQLSNLKIVLLENVAGFETSSARNVLLSTFSEWKIREFLVCPTYLGIPNSRLRYYFLAIKSKEDFLFGSENGPILRELLPLSPKHTVFLKDFFMGESLTGDNDCLLSDNILLTYGQVLDIVTPSSNHSCCFTKNYGRYLQGTGSVFTESTQEDIHRAYAEKESDKILESLQRLGLRYFSPQEISDLMGFPRDGFQFPDSTSRITRYKLLGNSLNVEVVSQLLLIALNRILGL